MRFVSAFMFAAALSFTGSAQDPAVPACTLLSLEDASAAFGEPANRIGDTPEAAGTSVCGWMGTVNFGSIAITLSKGEAFAGASAEAAYDALRAGKAEAGTLEDLPGVGEEAFLLPVPGVTNVFTLGLLKNGALVTIESTDVTHDAIIGVAKAAAGRM